MLSSTRSTLLALALLTPAMAVAQPATPQQRMDNQQARINQGVATGQLTRHEASADERHLRTDEKIKAQQHARDGGGPLTASQKARDNRLLHNNSARIEETKHNAREAPR